MNSTDTIQQLESQINQCMGKDRPIFIKMLRKIARKHWDNKNLQVLLKDLRYKIEMSKLICENRRLAVPSIEFPPQLPITDRVSEIAETIQNNQVVIIMGETGSGKTTQLPKICMSIGLGITGYIGHTQPRRIAARSIASKLASDFNSEIGRYVGYKIRFTDNVGDNAYVKLMTDGILLAEIHSDPNLNDYDVLIIDEAHERSLNIDFLLGYCKRVLKLRPDLKLIITSATIDVQRLSTHFNNAPIVEVSGRTYPVEIIYHEPVKEQLGDRTLQNAIGDAIEELTRIDRFGDILVFLSTEREIKEAAKYVRKLHLENTEVLPLYSRLSAKDQNKIFRNDTNRKIILSTNVAETSLTIPGIHYVIDSGYARISRYSYRSKIQRLPIEKISKSSANQRMGRCGRLRNGICIRLYSKEDFDSRPEYTEPEILRTNLASVILQMEYLKLGHITEFPFVDNPSNRYINDGYKLLYELQAVDDAKTLTKLGKVLAKLPIDPRLGRILAAANSNACLAEALTIVSVLSIQDPRERPYELRQKADAAQKIYCHENSDFLAYVKLWNDFTEKRKNLSKNQLRKYITSNFLSYRRMLEWQDVYRQLKQSIKKLHWKINQTPADYAQLHYAILTGLISNIGNKSEKYLYNGLRNIEFYIHPNTGVKVAPKWLMASELVETGKLYARIVAKIDPLWLESVAQHLLKKTYSEPHWDKKTMMAMAFERVSLYGLVIVSKRKIDYSRVDINDARHIFIREALVGQMISTNASFYKHNLRQLRELEKLDAKFRRPNLSVNDDILFNFYDERMPKDIYSKKTLDDWVGRADKKYLNNLFLSSELLSGRHSPDIDEAQFPNYLEFNGVKFKLKYHFEPGHLEDGVSLIVPLLFLNQLNAYSLEWLIPGLIKEKLVALIKCLPKAIRKNIVPVPHYVDQFLSNSELDKSKSIAEQLTRFINQKSRNLVHEDSWRFDLLADFYCMNIKVIDDNGSLIKQNRNLSQLQASLQTQSQDATHAIQHPLTENRRLTDWSFGDLPETVEIEHAGKKVLAYPCLVDKQDSVAIELLTDEAESKFNMHFGLKRLFILASQKQLKYIRKNIPELQSMCQHYVSLGTCEELMYEIEHAVIDRILFPDGSLIRKQQQFHNRLSSARAQFVTTSLEVCKLVSNILSHYHKVKKSLRKLTQLHTMHAAKDINQQLEQLISKHFITEVPNHRLVHIPRYLSGIEIRINKLDQSPGTDQDRSKTIAKYWDIYIDYTQQRSHAKKNLEFIEQYRWMLEEMRISLFAQELKTSIPISFKRLDAQLALIKKSSP